MLDAPLSSTTKFKLTPRVPAGTPAPLSGVSVTTEDASVPAGYRGPTASVAVHTHRRVVYPGVPPRPCPGVLSVVHATGPKLGSMERAAATSTPPAVKGMRKVWNFPAARHVVHPRVSSVTRKVPGPGVGVRLLS